MMEELEFQMLFSHDTNNLPCTTCILGVVMQTENDVNIQTLIDILLVGSNVSSFVKKSTVAL